MKPRAVAALLTAVLLAVLVVRVALVNSLLPGNPSRAARAWPSHPSAIMASALAEAGRAATEKRAVPRAVIERITAASAKAPLAPEPFLVRGVDATLAGELDLAGRSFTAARDRDPRSIPVRYFLADHFLRTGQVRQGLAEISTLTRLVPGSLATVGPYLATYARDPLGRDEVRRMLKRNPELEPVVLQALAADADNAQLALSLWSGTPGSAIQPWQQRLLELLIAAGRFHEAYSMWVRFAGNTAEDRSMGFSDAGRGPFSWTLASGSAGVVEAGADGAARVIYYGRDDQVLATRLVILQPGNHHIDIRISGVSGAVNSLSWTIRCLPSGTEIGQLPLGINEQDIRFSFKVPEHQCEAQRLELVGNAPDLPERASLTIASFQLESAGGQ